MTVAIDFGLTKENCPTNNAFVDGQRLRRQLNDDREFYHFVRSGKSIGFVAIEKSGKDKDTFYIEKLAVLPAFRNLRIGKQLMEFAVNRIKERHGRRISIGLIDAHHRLKRWYREQGFIEKERRDFPHLPFKVAFMELILINEVD